MADPLPGTDDSGILSSSFALSSTFGTNYDGSVDTSDEKALGYHDAHTGRWGANISDPALKGVALPEATIRQYIGDPKDPQVKADINSGKYQVVVETAEGRTGISPVVDMGPAAWTGKGIDLTGGLARDLNLKDNSYVHYQLRKKSDPASQQTPEEGSPVAQLRKLHPNYAGEADEKLIDTVYGASPKFKQIDRKQFGEWMKSPTGGKAIQDAITKGETPIQKLKDRHPELNTLSDEQIAIKILPIVQKKDPHVTLEGLKERLNPPKDNWAANWAKSIGSFALETAKQVPPQSADVVGSAWRGISEISQKGAQDEVTKLLPELGQGMDVNGWLALKPEEREAKLFQGKPLIGEGAPDSRSQDFLIALGQLDKNGEVQKANTWMQKVVGQIDQDNKGSLPAAQEQAAKTIAQAPAATLLQLFPGMRELANYGMLYDQNRKYLESKNPALGEQKINDMAMKMADMQFPAQETLGLILARGGGALTAGITNKVLKAGAEVALAGGTGAGVFTSNQLIRNIGSGDDWTKDLGESAFEGSLLGGVGAGTRLTFNGIKSLLSTSQDGKAASGTLQAVTELDPKEANDFVAGGTENAVMRKLDASALDLGLDAAFSTIVEIAPGDVLGIKRRVTPEELGIEQPDIRGARRFTQNLGVPGEIYPEDVIQIQRESIIPEVSPREHAEITERTRLPGLETTDTLRARYQLEQGPERYAKETEQAQKSYEEATRGPKPLKSTTGLKVPIYSTDIRLNLGAVQDSLNGAAQVRANGDNKTAAQKFDQGLSLMDDASRQKVADTIQQSVKVIAQKNPEPAQTKITGWQELKPWQTQADVPAGAETKIDPSGKTFWKAGPEKIQEVKPPDLTNFYGLENVPRGTTRGGIEPESGISGQRRAFADAQERASRSPDTSKLYEAYNRLVARTGLSSVKLSDLAREMGVSAQQLHAAIGQVKGANKELSGTNLREADYLPEERAYWMPRPGNIGADKVRLYPEEDDLMYSGANPFAAARATKEFLDDQAFFKNWNKVFAPERLGPEASDVAALGKGITATEKTASTMAMRVLADESELNSVIKKGMESSRRESYWHKYSKQELADIISKREKGEKTGNDTNDKMFDFYRKGYDYFGQRARANGIKLGWVEDYYRHSFKDSKAAQSFFQGREKMWDDPSFTKTRSFPTINDAIAAGLEPKTYNPERNFLGYVASVNNAIRKVQHLKQMAENGLAYPEGKNVPEVAREWEKIATPDGKEYRVHPDSAAVLANMYNISSVYDTIAGPFVSFAGAVKGVSGIKLSWSGFHPLHIMGVDIAQSLTTVQYRLVKGKVTGKDFLDALASPSRPVTAPFQYGRLRDIMTGKAGKEVFEQLTDQEKTDLRDLGEMGIVAHVSHERQMEWTQWLGRQANKIGPVSKAVSLGYKVLIAEPYQKIMFQHIIPALKISQALARRDTLLRLHPDLYSNRMLRAREYQKINRDIEGRFGEMFYDNLLWNSMAKQVGVSVPLSLGWTLGFWRIYGDGVSDLTDNAMHIDQIGKEATKNREWVTERMLYAANYSALAMVSCGLLTYAATGAIKSWMDFFYPRIGKKPNGDDERVRTPYFTTEWSSMYQHYAQNAQKGGDPAHGVIGGGTEYLMNKLNPGLQSIYEYWNNKDFRGREIHDPTDPWPTQLADTTGFFIQNMGLPMSAENIVAQPGAMTPEGTIASFFGLSSAPGWTGRTWIENSILTEYGRERGTEAGKSKKVAALSDAKKEYEESLKTGQGTLEARTKLKALGVTDRVIHESEKNYKIPIANRLFKILNPDVQVKMLKEMNPSERAEFLPYTSKKARALYERSLPQ